MVEYTKPWLSLDQQVEHLAEHGVEVGAHEHAVALLRSVGYYRLTGYLYPFRRSVEDVALDGSSSRRILTEYEPGTSLTHIAEVIDFDRDLRMLVMDGIERVEVAARMRVGYVLGRRSRFAHEDPATFLDSFTRPQLDEATGWKTRPSMQAEWLARVAHRRDGSFEAFVDHFRVKYENRMPIWALTEILELGHLSRLYRGLLDDDASEIARAFDVPTKKVMASWLASLNYVRNVAAHHARLFNRKLQYAPRRPSRGTVPLLEHLHEGTTAKDKFGIYSALAVIAYLLRSIEPDCDWTLRVRLLLERFPSAPGLTRAALGVPDGWPSLELWSAKNAPTADA